MCQSVGRQFTLARGLSYDMEVIWIEGQRYVIVPNNTHWPSIITNLKKRVAPISEDMVLSNLKDTQQRVTTFQPSAIAGRHAHKEGNFRRTVRIILTLLVDNQYYQDFFTVLIKLLKLRNTLSECAFC